jgi:single-strand DNA-binding protein
MNSVQLVGRLTKDPNVNYANSGTSVASFTVACDRKFKQEGGPSADFISCKAFGKTAEFIEKYFAKGQRIGLNGRIQTGSYQNKDGQTVYTTDVKVENVEFVAPKGSGNPQTNTNATTTNDGFMDIPADIDEELPFN